MKDNELKLINSKIRELDFQIRHEEDLIKKTDLEIKFAELMMKKAKMQSKVDEALKYKKMMLQKEIDYIELIENQDTTEFMSLGEFLNQSFDTVEVTPTGIKAIDNYFDGGLPVGTFIHFAAASGAGKTTTLMRIALGIAHSEKVAHFNFEMSDMLLHKVYFEMADLDNKKELENVLIIKSQNSHLKTLVKDIKLLCYREKIRFFIIDSRMKIRTDDPFKKDAAATISHTLSELVKTLGITIILINQLSEEAIKENKIALKESGDQYYDADIIFGLGFQYLYEEKKLKDDRVIKKIRKDEFNQPLIDKDKRYFKCEKNRLGDPYTDEIEIDEIFRKKKDNNSRDKDNEKSKNKESKAEKENIQVTEITQHCEEPKAEEINNRTNDNENKPKSLDSLMNDLGFDFDDLPL